MKYKKYPTEALLELLFMLGEQHQSNITTISNSWAHKEHAMVVALGENNDKKKALNKEILSRSKK